MDVQSIYTPSQLQDWYWEDKIWAKKDRQYSLRLWTLWTSNTKIRMILTWTHHVLHGTSRKSGEDIKTRCTGSIYKLLNRKDLSSINKIERNHPLWHTPSSWRNYFCIPKVVIDGMEVEKFLTRNLVCFLRHLDVLQFSQRFRLPHAIVKQAEHFRVRELVKKIESHPHREALQADLQQNKRLQPIQ